MQKNANKQPSVIIGFDETNNGFHLDNPNKRYHFHKDSVMVITGYMSPNITIAQDQQPKASKRKFFNRERDIALALKLGKKYIELNPDYFYTTIKYSDTKRIGYPLIRANAIALLSFKFFQHYELNPLTTQLAIDEIDGEKVSSSAEYFLQGWLENTNLPVDFEIMPKADKKILAVKKADRIGYYLAAIKFLGQGDHWPYRHRKVSMNQLENLAMQTQMNQ